MEKMKHLLSSRTAVGIPPGETPSEPHSVFHKVRSDLEVSTLAQEMRDCYQGLEEFGSAMRNLDGAGTQLTESLVQVLRGTAYQQVGEQLSASFREVYGSQGSKCFLEQLQDMEGQMLSQQVPSDASRQDLKILCAQTSCHMLLLFAKLQKQYFALCHQKMAALIHHLMAAKDPQLSAEVTKVILKLSLTEELSPEKTIVSLPSSPRSSPKLRKVSVQQGSPKSPQRSTGFRLLSLFDRRPTAEEGRSAFYVSLPDCEGLQGANVASAPQQDLMDIMSGTTLTSGSPFHTPSGAAATSCPVAVKSPPVQNVVPPPPVPVKNPPVQHLVPQPQPPLPPVPPSMHQNMAAFSSSILAAPNQAENFLLCSVPLVTRTDEMNNMCSPDFTLEDSAAGHLASEEDLNSIINLLSGMSYHCTLPAHNVPHTPTSMMSIPEDMLHDTSPPTPNSLHSGPELYVSRSPMQLAVPQLYRMQSPASDSQVEELQVPKLQAQVHRRSEGCLDLSSLGGNTWPHQQLRQHRASLPAVQLHSPHPHSSHPGLDPHLHSSHPGLDPFSTTPGWARQQDVSSHLQPYLSCNNNSSSSCGGSRGLSSAMLFSHGQQGSGFGAGGCGREMRGSGTWPLYQPLAMTLGNSLNSSWSGLQDGSEGSDDSSNGDHFFAVGKDLVTAIDSRHDSSEEEGDVDCNKLHRDFFDYNGQPGSTNTWPMIRQVPGPGLSLQLPPVAQYQDLLEPPHANHHRQLHMQWSDPLSTRSMWAPPIPGEVAGHKSSHDLQSVAHSTNTMQGFGGLH